jgi:predicted GNAT family acetyltransferase
VTVRLNDEESRYEAVDESGVVAGFAAFERDRDVVVLTHTEVDDAFEGRGVGSALAAGALDDVRTSGRRARVLCPFIGGYVERHPEYRDLLTDQ